MNIKEYRETENNKSGGTELFMSEYPLYCQYMLDIHEQYGHLDYHGPNPVGAHFKFYHSQVKKILEQKLQHVIEYGAGFTTLLLHKIKHTVDWNFEYYSYENIKVYYDRLKELGFDPDNCMEYVECYTDDKTEPDWNSVIYKHDLEKHKNVDLVIIDGPGKFFDGPDGVMLTTSWKTDTMGTTGNYKILADYVGRDFDLSIDGRPGVREYYTQYFKKKYGNNHDYGPNFTTFFKKNEKNT
jgi:hypothetical protein|tara:strand:+ start:4672 stop:5391 length:720 start_codon:yes stop_codon:yes gene_type:complete